MDYLCAKYDNFCFSRFGFLTCGQRDRQTDRIAEAGDRYTHATIVGVSKYRSTLLEAEDLYGNAVRTCGAEIK